jgi:hypothetical protein
MEKKQLIEILNNPRTVKIELLELACMEAAQMIEELSLSDFEKAEQLTENFHGYE